MDIQTILEAVRRNGGNKTAAAKELGMARTTLRAHLSKFSPELPVEDFQRSAAHHSPLSEERAPVRPHWDDDYDAEAEWERAATKNARRIEKALKRSKFTARFGGDPIAVAFVSDQHISIDNCVDLKRMREDAELIARTRNMYCCLVGDGVDNHIKHSSAIMASRSQPDDQYKLFDFYLGILAKKVLGVVTGNHDFWTNTIGGIDMVGWLCEQKKLCYGGHEAFIDVQLTGVEYTLGFRHQYRMNSSFNQTHSVKQWFRNGERDWDVGCIGHHHEPALESGLLKGKKRYFCRPGSYQITSAYSSQYGFNSTVPTCPTVILYPHERRLVGFDDLRDAAQWMGHILG